MPSRRTLNRVETRRAHDYIIPSLLIGTSMTRMTYLRGRVPPQFPRTCLSGWRMVVTLSCPKAKGRTIITSSSKHRLGRSTTMYEALLSRAPSLSTMPFQGLTAGRSRTYDTGTSVANQCMMGKGLELKG